MSNTALPWQPEFAGFWIRTAATLIDSVIFIIACNVPLYFIYGANANEKFIMGFWDVVLSYILPFVFTVWCWIRFFGTPGKMVFKLKVVDAESYGRMTVKQSTIRYFGTFVSVFALFIGIVWVAFDKKKQGWHDKMAKTVVIRAIVAPGAVQRSETE